MASGDEVSRLVAGKRYRCEASGRENTAGPQQPSRVSGHRAAMREVRSGYSEIGERKLFTEGGSVMTREFPLKTDRV
jgi:hypothetical protein